MVTIQHLWRRFRSAISSKHRRNSGNCRNVCMPLFCRASKCLSLSLNGNNQSTNKRWWHIPHSQMKSGHVIRFISTWMCFNWRSARNPRLHILCAFLCAFLCQWFGRRRKKFNWKWAKMVCSWHRRAHFGFAEHYVRSVFVGIFWICERPPIFQIDGFIAKKETIIFLIGTVKAHDSYCGACVTNKTLPLLANEPSLSLPN